MRVDIPRLRELLQINGVSHEIAASRIGVTRDTFQRRLRENGETFTVKESWELSNALNLNEDMILKIFFFNKK